MTTQIKVPELGESITEVQIAEWQKHEGDPVEKDETLATLESEKATVELPAPVAGILRRILKSDGEDANVGDVIGEIDEGKEGGEKDTGKQNQVSGSKSGRNSKSKQSAKQPKESAKGRGEQTEKPSGLTKRVEVSQSEEDTGPRIMPAAQALLEEHGLDAAEIEATGPGGRLLKEDVLAHLESGKTEREPGKPSREEPRETGESEPAARDTFPEKTREPEAAPAEPRPAVQAPASAAPKQERAQEVIRMSSLRRTVARRLVEAQRTMAMLTTFNEVDMSVVSALRNECKEPFQQRYGVKLGIMSFFVKAVIAALKETPRLNAEVRGDDIVLHHYFDIGVAIGAGKGLVVPSIRNAERLGFAEIEQVIADFATRALENRLKPEELEGGTFTISNGGVYGSLLSTPIINPPQSGILGLHAIQNRPVARDGEILIRPMMNVALSYDHRIVDGREAVTFLRRVKEFIESPPRLLLEV